MMEEDMRDEQIYNEELQVRIEAINELESRIQML